MVCTSLVVAASFGCTFPDYTVTTTEDTEVSLDDADVSTPIDGTTTDAPSSDADARDATIDGDAPKTDADADGGAGCPVTQLNFAFPTTPVKLSCTSSVILDVALPAGTEGMAFARANLTLKHASLPSIPYHWAAKLEVGANDLDQIAFPSGDDLCAGATAGKVVGGYGRINAANLHVHLTGVQSATLCSTGTVTVDPSSSIDVWVESTRPDCVGKSIVVASYMKTAGTTTPWDWPIGTTPTAILTAKIATAASDTSLVTMAMIEGTAATNPNTSCGSEVATLTVKTTLDGATLSTTKQPVPATPGGGEGHLLLDTFHQAPESAGVHTVQLLAGRDFITSKVTTGGSTGGDALLAIVRK
jgi:hypothetical protein